jgi:hypothetical protein
MNPTYELINVEGTTIQLVKRTDPDGTIWWIPEDPENSDYQAYLASLNEPAQS